MRIYVETDGTQDFLALAGQIAAEVTSHVGFTPLVKVVEIGAVAALLQEVEARYRRARVGAKARR